MIVTNMLKEKRVYNYKMNNIIEYTSHILEQANVNIIHCYREANQVADSLAKLVATSTEESYYFSFQQLPKTVKGPFQLDKYQMPRIKQIFLLVRIFILDWVRDAQNSPS